MSIRVYDTRRRAKLPFEKKPGDRVGIYTCGMTVQDKPHVGHMRSSISGDVIRRWLEERGYVVTYVYNFTDIDDKIIAKAQDEGVGFENVSRRNEQAYLDYAARLQIKPATHYPRATEHIAEIHALIQKLIDRGHAYAAAGDVYFDVRSFSTYGQLSGHNVDDLRSGSRIEVGESKKDPLDFTLWKGAKPGEPSWPSPWGPGRPGWHIECSAMAMKYLGETLDFHGGGQDLIFPHHENEKAQSEAANGKPFVDFWVENGMVNLGGEKMSKSTKHFFLIEDVLGEFEPDVVRFYLQSTHYRSPIEWNEERLREAGTAYARLRDAIAKAARLEADAAAAGGDATRSALHADAASLAAKFEEAMDDDFNAARAQGHLFELAKEINRVADNPGASSDDKSAVAAAGKTLQHLGKTIGLFGGAGAPEEGTPEAIQELVRQRDKARLEKDWKRADVLRGEIEAQGFVLEDAKGGTIAKRKR
ncbi:MAG TPA: cysteine--tRNA ligase [Candidatus Eisenbacteria bacterium]|nr:cysteine--tRNA ligase [Candidatus Eisenbacteria bacterium]